MRCLHDLLREKPPSFMLGQSKISTTSLMWSVHLDFLTRMLVLCSWIQVNNVFCHCNLRGVVQADVLVMLFDPCLNLMSSLSNVHLPSLWGTVYRTDYFRAMLTESEEKLL
jgi:hypothetical protein